MFHLFLKNTHGPLGDLDMACAVKPANMSHEKNEYKERSKNRKNPHDDNDDEVNLFINDQIPKLQQIIMDTIKNLDASQYTEQHKYLEDVFDRSADKCWDYMKKLISNEEKKENARYEMLQKITEDRVKEIAMMTATALFVQLAAESDVTEE